MENYQFSFYYISTKVMSWNESRRNCTDRGADLLKINTSEEQDFARKMSTGYYLGAAVVHSIYHYFWIGLTDIDEQGTWEWVDGSTLTSGFWTIRQPNGKRLQNCVVAYLTWADAPYQWLSTPPVSYWQSKQPSSSK
ncbi:C-type lectin domain family 4 member E-like [Pseudorasbora parva]|uniref:C-type lectin domain family 4 member E-like n=1 Tax=Pseudorasbora parva TaxID=51549 RepID=UPI00351E4AFD